MKSPETAQSVPWGYEAKGNNPFPGSTSCAPVNAAQDAVAFVGSQGTLLTCVQPFSAELLSSQFLPLPLISGLAEAADTAGHKLEITSLRTQCY